MSSSNVDRQMLKQCRELILQNQWEPALSKACVYVDGSECTYTLHRNAILEFHHENYHAYVREETKILPLRVC